MRILRLAALFGSVALIVAAAGGYVARHNQLANERDLRVEHVAQQVSAGLSGLVEAARVASTLGDDPAAAVAALAPAHPAVDVCAVAPADLTVVECAGPSAGDPVAAEGDTTLADGGVVVAPDGDRVQVTVVGDSLTLLLGVDGDDLRADGDAAVVTFSDAAPPSPGPDTVDGRRTVAEAVDAVDGLHAVASVPAEVALDPAERWLIAILTTLAFLLLALAAVTMRSERRTLVERASIDPLTRLPNRSEFERRTEILLASARRTETGVCLLLFDLNGFKLINDTRGHQAGDEVLRVIGRRLRKAVRESDIVARWGGDEFVLVLPGIEDASLARTRAGALAALICEPVGEDLQVGASVGIAMFPRHGATLPELVEAADAAMYAAKRDGVTHRLAGVESAPIDMTIHADDRREQARVR